MNRAEIDAVRAKLKSAIAGTAKKAKLHACPDCGMIYTCQFPKVCKRGQIVACVQCTINPRKENANVANDDTGTKAGASQDSSPANSTSTSDTQNRAR
jgi:hypothetical protein